MTVNEAAKKWGCTPARVGQLLRDNRVPGAARMPETAWVIPDDAPRPEPLKRGRKPHVEAA